MRRLFETCNDDELLAELERLRQTARVEHEMQRSLNAEIRDLQVRAESSCVESSQTNLRSRRDELLANAKSLEADQRKRERELAKVGKGRPDNWCRHKQCLCCIRLFFRSERSPAMGTSQSVWFDEQTEQRMRNVFQTLSEKDRRRFAAVQAVQLGRGGITYIAQVLGCSIRTVSRGIRELDHLSEEDTPGRIRRPGAGRPKNCSRVTGRAESGVTPGDQNRW